MKSIISMLIMLLASIELGCAQGAKQVSRPAVKASQSAVKNSHTAAKASRQTEKTTPKAAPKPAKKLLQPNPKPDQDRDLQPDETYPPSEGRSVVSILPVLSDRETMEFIDTLSHRLAHFQPKDSLIHYFRKVEEYVAEPTRFDGKDTPRIQSLLYMAAGKSLYNTAKYRIFLSPANKPEGISQLYVVDLLGTEALRDVAIQTVTIDSTTVEGKPQLQIGIQLLPSEACRLQILTWKILKQEAESDKVREAPRMAITVDDRPEGVFSVSGVVSGRSFAIASDEPFEVQRQLASRLQPMLLPPVRPQFSPQYRVGRPLTYRVENHSLFDPSLVHTYTFQIVPKVVSDTLRILEYKPDSTFFVWDQQLKYLIDPFCRNINRIIQQHPVRLTVLPMLYQSEVSYNNDKALQGMFNRAVDGYLPELKQICETQNLYSYSSELASMKTATKMPYGLYVLFAQTFDAAKVKADHPELYDFTAIDCLFQDGQRAGTRYFAPLNDLVDFTITKQSGNTIIQLRDSATGYFNYQYVITPGGQIQSITSYFQVQGQPATPYYKVELVR